jgi:tetratricopeptide (TPR) repeat protein
MSIVIRNGLVLLILALPWCGAKVSSKENKSSSGTAQPVWKFTTLPQMRAIITKCLNNPRATYYIILRARELGMEKDAALFYRSFLHEKNKDGVREPKHDVRHGYVMAAYAFSHFVAVGPYSRDYFNKKPSSLVRRLCDYGLEAEGYRTGALQEEPNSPEVLLMTSIAEIEGSSPNESREEHIMRVIGYTRKAVRLAPDWADAHYWLAKQINSRAVFFPKRTDSLYREALIHYTKAETLEPQLRPECLRGRASLWHGLGQKQNALKCLEAYLKLKPEALKQSHIAEWRQRLIKELKVKGAKSP